VKPVVPRPSRDYIGRQVIAYWERARRADTATVAALEESYADKWLELLFEQMTPTERAQVAARPVNERISCG
jgi:hypothetical protein